jgi:hypothetical protein
MNNSVLIPVMVVLGLALISGLVIIPEISDSQSQSTEEAIEWATGCELNVYVDDNGTEIEYMVCFDGDLKKLDKIIENQEIIKDQLSEIYDLNS